MVDKWRGSVEEEWNFSAFAEEPDQDRLLSAVAATSTHSKVGQDLRKILAKSKGSADWRWIQSNGNFGNTILIEITLALIFAS